MLNCLVHSNHWGGFCGVCFTVNMVKSYIEQLFEKRYTYEERIVKRPELYFVTVRHN